MSLPNEVRHFDVVVAGGGPTGLASALLAASLGRSVALIAPPRPLDERTTALLAGTVPLFKRFGVWNEIAAAAAPLKRIRIVDASARLIRAPEILFDAAEIGLDAFGYNLPNRTLTEILDRAVASRGITRIEASAERIAPGAESVEIETSTGVLVDARLLVAADGRHSRARQAAGIDVTEWHYEQSALVLNLSHAAPHNDTSTEFHTPTGPFTLVPLAPNRSSLVCVESAEGAATLAGLSDDALALEIERRSSSILGAITVDGPRQVFSSFRHAREAVRGETHRTRRRSGARHSTHRRAGPQPRPARRRRANRNSGRRHRSGCGGSPCVVRSPPPRRRIWPDVDD